MNNDTLRQLSRLKMEDLIWIIYFFILAANLYSNKLQEDNLTKTKYTNEHNITIINITILSIIFLIYLYFFIRSWEDYERTKRDNRHPKKKQLAYLTLIASILFLISGAIAIYVEYHNGDEEEIGFI